MIVAECALRRILARRFGVPLVSGIAMESKPALPESTTRSTRLGRFSRLQIVGFVTATLLLVLTIVLVITSLTASKVEWLTPTQLSRSIQPGPFTAFKQKVRNLVGPVWRRIRRTPPQIAISSSLLTLSATTAEQIGLGTPTTANADGTRAWLLTPAESGTLRQQLKTNSGAVLLGNPSIMTLNGGQARVVVGNSTAMIGNPRTGTTVDLIPKVVSGAVKVTIAATSVESVVAPGNAQSIRTNFAMACQAVIPNGGSLVLDGGPLNGGGENRYWLIVSPRVWIPSRK